MRTPPPLASNMARQRRQEMEAYIAYVLEGSQQRRAPLDRRLLADPEISSGLLDGFRRACAYCETPIHQVAPPPCHHRPAGVAASLHGETDFLHYVWLAYEWENLYLACEICAKHKENRFPVRERGPLRAPIGELRELEGELLLDPCFHDPSKHLLFRPEGLVQPMSEQGEATIKTLALNRLQLVEGRRKAYLEVVRLIGTDTDLTVERTGLPGGPASEVVRHRAGRFLAHPGATSLMLMDLAGRRNAPARELGEFLFFLVNERPAVRATFLSELEPSSEPLQPSPPTPEMETPVPVKGRRRAKRPRRFRIGEQPLATIPMTRVRIDNFKALRSLDFALPVSVEDSDLVPCMIILGENSAGKSSVLEAITLALLGSRETEELDKLLLDHETRPRDVAHRPDPRDWDLVTGPVAVEIEFMGSDAVIRISGEGDARRFEGSSETAKVLLAYGPRRFFSSRKTRRFRAPARRVRSLFDPMATIANPIDWLVACEPGVFDVAARALREILMLGATAEFKRDHGRLRVETETDQLPLEEMSVGYKSVIAMATDIMRELLYHYDNLEYAHAVVLIDEIETHLHPRWKMRIISLLRRAFPKVQFVITTHDPLCLRGTYDGEVFVLRRSDESRSVESVEELPSIRGMRAEQILTSEFFGLGSTDPETDAKMIRYHNLVVQGAETDEVERLRLEIEATMKVGDTVQEQVYAEALRKAAIDPFVPLAKVGTRARRDMVRDLLGAIAELRESHGPEEEE